jgi:hypothetical protein
MVEYVQREAKWRVINDGTKKIVIECAERPKFNQFGLDIKKVTREEAALAFPSIHNWP